METLLLSDANTAYWRFIQGFLLGQITLFIMMYLLIKYWFLDDSKKMIYNTPSKLDDKFKLELERKKTVHDKVKKNFTKNTVTLNIHDAEILSKTYYEILEHNTESCDWLNVLLAQVIHHYRMECLMHPNFVSTLEDLLNSDKKPGLLGSINLTELSFGNEYPIFKDIEICYKDGSRVYAEMLLSYQDKLSVGLDTSILLGITGIDLAALPISLNLSLIKLEAQVKVELIPTIENEIEMIMSFNSDYILDLQINSLLGHRSKLKDVPKVRDLILNRVNQIIKDHLVTPQGLKLKLPKIDPILSRFIPKVEEEIVQPIVSS